MIEQWKIIPGFKSYQASNVGNIRRVYPNGETRVIKAFQKKSSQGHQLVVNLFNDDGVRKNVNVIGVLAKAWYGPTPDGMVPYHKNGMKYDNRITNIGYISKSELGKKSGGKSRRKPVVKIGPDLQDVEYYPSASAAGRANNFDPMTICSRCNGNVKKGPAPDGFEYAWDDEACSRRWAIRRMEQSQEYISPMPAPKYEFEF